MVRSYPRNNFLDILRDPLAVTIMASIGLHATLGAFLLPIITKAQPEGKKAEPSTVKVVELTPNELQRIPQLPKPIPTPAPVTIPPVYQPTTPVAPTVPTATIPATPVRTPAPKTPTKTPQPTKTPAVKPATKSSSVDFNPEKFNNPSPSPKPAKSPVKKGETKPSPTPTPSLKPTQPTKKVTTEPSNKPQPSPEANTDDDGGDSPQANNPAPQPTPANETPQPKTPSPTSTGEPNPTPSGSQPAPGDGQSGGSYGSFAQAVSSKLQEYYTKYPDLKHIQLPLKKVAYPDKVPCSKIKQPPFVIFIPVFGKTPKNQDPNFGSTLAESEEATVFVANAAAGNKDLIDLARSIAAEVAQQADKNRAEVDKDRPVAYSTKVEFDPATCKN
jgi:hypothetical protein